MKKIIVFAFGFMGLFLNSFAQSEQKENLSKIGTGASILKISPIAIAFDKLEMTYEKFKTDGESTLFTAGVVAGDNRYEFERYGYMYHNGISKTGLGIGLAKRKYINNFNDELKRNVRFLHFVQVGAKYDFTFLKYFEEDQIIGDTFIVYNYSNNYSMSGSDYTFYSYKNSSESVHRTSLDFIIGTMFVVSEAIMLEAGFGGSMVYSFSSKGNDSYFRNWGDPFSPYYRGVAPNINLSLNILLKPKNI